MSRINFNSGGRSSPVSFISRYFPLLLIAGVIIYLFVSGNLSKVISTITNTFSNLFSKSGSAVDSLMQNVGVFDSNADKAAKAAIGDSKSLFIRTLLRVRICLHVAPRRVLRSRYMIHGASLLRISTPLCLL